MKTILSIVALLPLAFLAASCAAEDTGVALQADVLAICGCEVNVPPAGFTTVCGASGVDECVYVRTEAFECVNETGCTHTNASGVEIVHPIDEVVFRYVLVANAAGHKPACCPLVEDKRNRCKIQAAH